MKKYPNKALDFTHFASLPFIRKTHRDKIRGIQDNISAQLTKITDQTKLKPASNMLMHLTLSMLILPNNQIQAKVTRICEQFQEEFSQQLRHTTLTFSKVGYFTRFNRDVNEKQVNVIYLQPEKDEQLQKVKKITDKLIRRMLQVQIVKQQQLSPMHIIYNKETCMFENKEHHLTLFRISSGVPYNDLFKKTIQNLAQNMLPLSLECDFFDISTRFKYDQTKFYTPLARVSLQSLA